MAWRHLSPNCRSMRRRQLIVLLFVLAVIFTGFHIVSSRFVDHESVTRLLAPPVTKPPSAPVGGVSATVPDGGDNNVGCPSVTNHICPDPENVKFFLYTRLNPNEPQVLSPFNISSSHFNANKPTKIIVHGFNSDANLFALVDMRRGYLRDYDYNVIAVDWGFLSQGSFLCYPTAILNGKHVAECCAQFVHSLRNVGATDFHVIGFSLGAHVAAFLANHLRPFRLRRITGLDPAMPLFVTVADDEKLDAGDAHYVDVFHTNAFVQGKIEQSGHSDFYFNGGSRQPGCGESDFGCSHVRAAVYFAESINSPAGFWGWSCPSYFAYVLGLCRAKMPSVLAGEHVSNRTRGFYLVRTASKVPYAVGRQA